MFRLQSFALVATMATVAIVGVVALVMLTRSPTDVTGPGLVPSPSPAQSVTGLATATPQPTAALARYNSAGHGYSIDYPIEWTVTPATESWPFGTGIPGGPGNPAALDIFNSGRGPRVVVTSQLLPADGRNAMKEFQWRDAYRAQVVDRYGEACFPPPDKWEHQTIEGRADLGAETGFDLGVYAGCGFVEAMTFAGVRAYTFTIERPDEDSRLIFDRMLKSISFDADREFYFTVDSAVDDPAGWNTNGWISFHSERHAYSIQRREDWSVVPATEPWPYGTGVPGGPGNLASLDIFRPEVGTSRIVATSQLLPDGLTETEWRDDYRAQVVERFGQTCLPAPDEWEHLTGRVAYQGEGGDIGLYTGCGFVEAMAFASHPISDSAGATRITRVYTLTLENPDAASRSVYDHMLETVVFYPLEGYGADDSTSP